MKKENYSFNVTEDNAAEFAVVSAAELKRISEYVSLLRQQLGFLDSQLESLGIKSWDIQVKTLADLPVYKRPE